MINGTFNYSIHGVIKQLIHHWVAPHMFQLFKHGMFFNIDTSEFHNVDG